MLKGPRGVALLLVALSILTLLFNSGLTAGKLADAAGEQPNARAAPEADRQSYRDIDGEELRESVPKSNLQVAVPEAEETCDSGLQNAPRDRVQEASRGSAAGEAGRELTVEATAYSHTGNRTYTGTWPRDGHTIAVDPQTIPIGSRVYIRGMGWRVAEDRIPPESVKKGATVDIFFDERAECLQWGRRFIQIVVQ